MSEIIGRDFQGWPIKMLTLKEMLVELGFKVEDGKLSIDYNDPILEAYPRLLEDDGMGYGVRAEYVTEADREIYERKMKLYEHKVSEDGTRIEEKIVVKKVPVFNIFRDVLEQKTEEDLLDGSV